MQRRAVIVDLTADLYVCSKPALRIISNLMTAFWILLFQQVSPGMWGLSVNHKLKVNATSCTLAFSGKFPVIRTSRV